MKTLEDVLLYLARMVPAGHQLLADMEQIIKQHFASEVPQPAGEDSQQPGF